MIRDNLVNELCAETKKPHLRGWTRILIEELLRGESSKHSVATKYLEYFDSKLPYKIQRLSRVRLVKLLEKLCPWFKNNPKAWAALMFRAKNPKIKKSIKTAIKKAA